MNIRTLVGRSLPHADRLSASIPVLFGIVIPSGIALGRQAPGFVSNASLLQVAYFALLISLVALLFRRSIQLSNGGFVVALISQFFVRLLWYEDISPDNFHDFRMTWDAGVKIAEASSFHWANSLYFCRALPVFAPLNWLSPENIYALVIVNSVLVLLISLGTYVFLKRLFAIQIAQAATIVSGIAPEVIAASAVPSHDVLGTFFLFVSFASFYVVVRSASKVRWLWFSIGLLLLGFSTVLVHLQRLPTDFLLPFYACVAVFFSLHLWSSHKEAHQPARVYVGLVAALLSIVIAIGCVHLFAMDCTSPRLDASNKLSYWPSFTNGTWEYKNDLERLFESATDQQLRTIAGRLFLSDLADSPELRLKTLSKKLNRLFSFGASEAYFYKWNGPRGWSQHVDIYMDLSKAFRMFWLLICTLGGVAAIGFVYKVKPSISERLAFMLPVLFLAVFVIALLLLGEVAQRYMFPIYFVGPLLLASLLYWLGEFRCANVLAAGRAIAPYVVSSILLVVVGYFSLSGLANLKSPYSGSRFLRIKNKAVFEPTPIHQSFKPLGPYGHEVVFNDEQTVIYSFCDAASPIAAQMTLFLGRKTRDNTVPNSCYLESSDGVQGCTDDGFYATASTKHDGCHIIRVRLGSSEGQSRRWIGLVTLKGI